MSIPGRCSKLRSTDLARDRWRRLGHRSARVLGRSMKSLAVDDLSEGRVERLWFGINPKTDSKAVSIQFSSTALGARCQSIKAVSAINAYEQQKAV